MADGFIPFSTQLDFIWNELQGNEKAGFGKFLSSGASTPEDFATLWDETYERSGGAGNEKARTYAGSVYNSLQGPRANPDLISPNAKTAFEFFRGKGLSPEMSSGITGRLMAESYEGLNPDARNRLGGGMGAYGIAQWRGPRMQDLANFAGVDINDITKLPNSFEGGGLLSPDAQSAAAMSFGNNEASKMINQFPDPMATDQDPAKRQGFGGLLDYLKKADPNTGLNRYDKFAASLDSLIMPEMRAGQSIREAGMQRVAARGKNKTIEMLRARGREDLAKMVENGMISYVDAASQLLAKKKPIVVGNKLIDPDTYEVLYGAPAPEGGDFKDASAFRKEFTSLNRIKNFSDVTEAYTRIVKSASNPSPAGDLALIFNYMKVLDPSSVVRESEFAAAARAGSFGDRIQAAAEQLKEGTLLAPDQRADFVSRATNLYRGTEEQARPLYTKYANIAKARGFDPDKVLPEFGYVGELFSVAPEFEVMSAPPIPQGATANGAPIDQATWEKIWSSRSAQEKKKFMETGAFE